LPPNALAYVTGGAAGAGLLTAGTVFVYDPNGNPITNPFSYVAVNPGWTVGGGVEARLIGNVTGKIEYLYMDYGSMTTNINSQTVMTLTADTQHDLSSLDTWCKYPTNYQVLLPRLHVVQFFEANGFCLIADTYQFRRPKGLHSQYLIFKKL